LSEQLQIEKSILVIITVLALLSLIIVVLILGVDELRLTVLLAKHVFLV
jgi:hypothetical protein